MEFITLLLILVNVIVSYKGFSNQAFFDGYKFEVDRILVNKDYKRLITSGFLHINWMHLLFNMLSLYAFSNILESSLGGAKFLTVYMASLIGGDLLSLLIHKHHSDYSAVGASGAVCGIIFASIAIFPGMGVGFFGLPFSIPGWLYGILYVGYSIYGVRSAKDNIGHDAHLGGALIGMLTALAFVPGAFVENYPTILIITLPTLAFIYLIISRPQWLLVDNLFYKTHSDHYSIDHRYNEEKTMNQKQIDKILDKINTKGMDSLSNAEKEKLKQYSKKLR
ncbi:MAG: rhomboid family intramembrane serine protease [Bacteroidota bacterium]|nr:rhomboid family intramembrane serine protease [Bacteroidota bacterium]